MLGRILLIAVAAAALSACATEICVVVAGDDACATYGFRGRASRVCPVPSRVSWPLAATGRSRGRHVLFATGHRGLCGRPVVPVGIVPYSAGFDQCVQREFACASPGLRGF